MTDPLTVRQDSAATRRQTGANRVQPMIDVSASDHPWSISMESMRESFAAVPYRASYGPQPLSAVDLNRIRAARISRLLTHYATDVGHVDNVFDAFRDMLNDARHLADALGIDWSDAADPLHYTEEIDGSFGSAGDVDRAGSTSDVSHDC